MNLNLDGIHKGLAVYGLDGEQLGTVTALRVEDRLASDATADAGLTGDLPSGGAEIDMDPRPAGQAGTLPLGVTTPKDRGGENAVNRAALRDPQSIDPATSADVPGAAGADVMRGYAPRRRDVDDGASEASARSATGDLYGGGVSQTERAMLTSSKAVVGADDDVTERLPKMNAAQTDGYLLVEDAGTLGVMAGGLRVPLSAIRSVEPGMGVILDCTAEQARGRWKHRGLVIDETADVTPF